MRYSFTRLFSNNIFCTLTIVVHFSLTRDFCVPFFAEKMRKETLLLIALVVLCCKVTTPLGKTTFIFLGCG